LNHYIIPLHSHYQSGILHLLNKEDPWHIIAYDGLLQYGLNHHEHQWFGEFINNRMVGAIYHHQGLLHFVYPNAPDQDSSPIYSFVSKYFPSFITHGKKDIVLPIIENLKNYKKKLNEECEFVQETPKTKEALQLQIPWPSGLRIRLARAADWSSLMQLFKNSTFEEQVDPSLVLDSIKKSRVYIAEKDGQVIGSIMILKESMSHSLIGGLYVDAQFRKLGIASHLAQFIIREHQRRRKKLCFYYSDSTLQDFYKKGFCTSLGKWISYQLIQTK